MGRPGVERRAQAGDGDAVAEGSGATAGPGSADDCSCGRGSRRRTVPGGRRPLQVTRAAGMTRSGCSTAVSSCTSTSRTRAATPVEIGGLGFPVVFNNMIQNFVTNRARTLPQAHEICSFFDPYVGRDAGYLQVTRLSGAGPALLVVPEPGTQDAVRSVSPAERRVAPRSDVRGRVRVDVAQPGVRGERVEERRRSGTRRRR